MVESVPGPRSSFVHAPFAIRRSIALFDHAKLTDLRGMGYWSSTTTRPTVAFWKRSSPTGACTRPSSTVG